MKPAFAPFRLLKSAALVAGLGLAAPAAFAQAFDVVRLFGAAPEPMSLWAMLGGGLLAFVSPCVLPMLPVYAMYLLGGTDAAPGRLRVLRRCLGLLLGFCVSAAVMTPIFDTTFGKALAANILAWLLPPLLIVGLVLLGFAVFGVFFLFLG